MNRYAIGALQRAFRCLGYYPTNINGVPARVVPDHVGFWRRVAQGAWEPETLNIIRSFASPKGSYWDVGAWIGATSIYASRHFAKVVAFEPDPIAFRYLLGNLALNKLSNVRPFNVAVAVEPGLAQMSSLGDRLGDSMTSLLPGKVNHDTVTVLQESIERFVPLADETPVSLMKIDVEGYEFTLLPSLQEFLARRKPTVHISLHAPYLPVENRKAAMVGLLGAFQGYSRCLDPDLRPIDRETLLSAHSLAEFSDFVFCD